MQRLLRAAFAATLSILLVAGGSLAITQSDDDIATLQAAPWTLTTLDGQSVPASAGITADFSPDGSLSGSGGCNQYSGGYSVDGITLTVSALASTRMACAPDVMDTENLFLDLLQNANAWMIAGGALVLTAADGGILEFGGDGSEPATFENTVWTLTSLGGATIDPSSGVTAQFAEDFTISGSGGCNQYNGDYSIDAGLLAIGPLAATRMACEPDVMDLENDFLSAMERVSGFSLEGSTLTLSSDNGVEELVFDAGASAASGPLTGVSWTLVDLDGEAIFAEDGLSVTFAEDGTLSGFGGCNDLFGSYTADSSSITVGALASTRKSCDPDVMTLEATYIAILSDAAAWETQADALTITAVDGATLSYLAVDTPVDSSSVVGPLWQLNSLNELPIPPALARVTLALAPDGTYTGNGGCNDFSGTYTLDGTDLELSDLSLLTQNSCNATVTGVEQGFMSILPFVDSAEVVDGQLHLDSSLGVQTVWDAQ